MRLRRLTRAAVAVAAVLPTSVAVTAARAATTAVVVARYQYQPDPVTVNVGATVSWTNHDAVHHDVTSVAGGPLASPELAAGDTWSVTFDQPGTYAYICSLHPDMTGTVVVDGAPPPARASATAAISTVAGVVAPVVAPVVATRPGRLTAQLNFGLVVGALAAGVLTFVLLALGASRRRLR